MAAHTRRFTSTLCLVFGPLSIAGGYLTIVEPGGAIYISLGLGVLVCGALLRTRAPLWTALAAGCLVFVALTVDMMRG
jgi:hypothetical protein